MRCDDVATALPGVLDRSSRADRRVVRHVETCLRCQAELARYRRLLRLLHQLRDQRPPLPPGAVGDVLAALDERAGKELVRSAMAGRRFAVVGGVAAVAVATAVATVAVVAGRTRAARTAAPLRGQVQGYARS